MRRIPSTVIECSFCDHKEVLRSAPSSKEVDEAIERHNAECWGYQNEAKKAEVSATDLVRVMHRLGFDMKNVDIPFVDPEVMKQLREDEGT